MVEDDVLALEQLPLDRVSVLAAQADAPLGVDHPVPRNGGVVTERVKRIAHLPSVPTEARDLGDLTVGRHPAARNLLHHAVDSGIRRRRRHPLLLTIDGVVRPVNMRVRLLSALVVWIGASACTPPTDPARPSLRAAVSAPAPRTTVPPADASDGWQTRAAAYLDGRSRAWLDGPPRAGQRVDCALSCHTTHPFLFARPRLGSSAVVVDLEARLRARVSFEGAWPEQTPFYGNDDSQRAKQSLGTEAVLNAVSLALLDHALGRAATASTLRAVERMWEVQRDDGGFDWLDFGLEPWEAGNVAWGAAMAAVAVGHLPAEVREAARPRVDRLRQLLRERRSAMNAHDQLTVVWAANRLEGLLDDAERDAVVSAVASDQLADGGWANVSLVGAQSRAEADAYATAFTTFVLCTAAPTHPAIDAAVAWLRAHQGTDGGWATPSANGDSERGARFMTDAATAYASLALVTCAR